MKERFEKTQSKFEFITGICQDLYRETPELIQGIAIRLDVKRELRAFTSLGTRDYEILNPGERGSIGTNVRREIRASWFFHLNSGRV